MEFTPYEATAFITEVKQTLTSSALIDDLQKLGKLDSLAPSDFGGAVVVQGPFAINRTLRILFYHEKEVLENRIVEILKDEEFVKSWDITAILQENVVFLNPLLPLASKMERASVIADKGYPLIKTMFFTSASIRYPVIADAWGLFVNLLNALEPENKN